MLSLANRENAYRRYDHGAKLAAGFEFTIDYNGNWYAHGGAQPGPIRREAIAALFGGAGKGFMAGKGLVRDSDGRYFLQSPEGRYGVDVEDAPFIATVLEAAHKGGPAQALDFITSLGERVAAGADHPLYLAPESLRGTPVLYIEVRPGLSARLAKPVYEEVILSCAEVSGRGVSVRSRGMLFPLGGAGDAGWGEAE